MAYLRPKGFTSLTPGIRFRASTTLICAVVVEEGRVVPAVGRDEVDDADHVGRGLLDRHPVLLDLGREARLGRRHLVLDVDGGDVLVVADVERGDDVGQAVGGAVRVEVDLPLDAVDLLLDRGRDGVGDGLGVGAGVGRGDLDLGRHDVRVERDRQDEDADAADQQHQQGQHRGEDRPADEEVDHGSSRSRGRGSASMEDVGPGAARIGSWLTASASAHRARRHPRRPSRPPGPKPAHPAGVAGRAGGRRLGGVCDRVASRGGPSRSRRGVGRRRPGLDRHPGADQLQPLDDHLLAGLQARFEDAEALVGEGRPDGDDRHLALLVDRVDGRAGLRLHHGLLGDDDRVPGLADLGVDLHVLAGQDRLLRVGDLRLDQEGGGRRVDRVVDDRRLAREAAGLLPLEPGPEDLDGEPLAISRATRSR